MAIDFKTGSELVVIKPVDHWSKVDRRIIDDTSISIEARGVLTWIGSRPDGHKLFIQQLQTRCCINKSRWLRIRKELTAAGYFKAYTVNKTGGRLSWVYEVNLAFDTKSTVALKTAYGSTANGKTTHIKEIDKNKEKDIKEKRSTSCVATRKSTKQNQDPCKPMLAGENQKQTQTPKETGERKAKSESQNLDTETANFFEELNKPNVNCLWGQFIEDTKASYYWKKIQQAELLRRFNTGENISAVLTEASLYNFRDLRILDAIQLPNYKYPASKNTRDLLRAGVSL